MDKTKAKYKPGDRVRVRADLTNGGGYFMPDGRGQIVVKDMMIFAGEIVTIEEASESGYRIRESVYTWTDEMFEPVQPIVIYHKGDKVIALDKNTGKKGVAKCSPDDQFDFYTGAKLAFDRLIEQGPEFKVGDIVVGLPEADNAYRVTCSGWKGLVVRVLRDHIQVEGIGASDNISQYSVNPKYFRKIEEEKRNG